MGDPHFGRDGAWFFIAMGLIPVAAVVAAFIAWWAKREGSRGLVKLATVVLISPWLLSLPSGLGAPIVLLLFPTSWLSPVVGIALVLVSLSIRRIERDARRNAASARQPSGTS
jgi:hypothetical protein